MYSEWLPVITFAAGCIVGTAVTLMLVFVKWREMRR